MAGLWTKEEINILYEKYPMLGTKISNQLPNRNVASIKKKAASLNIRVLNPNNKCNNETFDIKNTSKYIRVGEYKGALIKIDFLCPDCNKLWNVRPSSILYGNTCTNCSSSGFKQYKMASLYILSIITINNNFIKVGITNRDISSRIKQISSKANQRINISEVYSISSTGYNIRRLESYIHSNYQHYYPKELFDGFTECYTIDKLDNILKDINDFIF
jgi:hypothetical protein